jgi:predicted nuclease of predicted toxin-antitoxin system
MVRLYADEQFPYPVVERLRARGYDILTVQTAGKDNQRIPDEDVLSFAIERNRAVITINRKDFKKLHDRVQEHRGIIICTKNDDWESFTDCINLALQAEDSIEGKLIRINRPVK